MRWRQEDSRYFLTDSRVNSRPGGAGQDLDSQEEVGEGVVRIRYLSPTIQANASFYLFVFHLLIIGFF